MSVCVCQCVCVCVSLSLSLCVCVCVCVCNTAVHTRIGRAHATSRTRAHLYIPTPRDTRCVYGIHCITVYTYTVLHVHCIMYYSVCVRIVRAAFTSLKEAVGIDYGPRPRRSVTHRTQYRQPPGPFGGREGERGGEREKYSTVN